jgi:hypothetical protein
MDKDTDNDTDKDTDMELESFCQGRRNSPYSAIWMTYAVSRCKFLWRYVLASLPEEN